MKDELYEKAKEIILDSGKVSASLLQRRLKIGYAQAVLLLDMLEEKGIIEIGSTVCHRIIKKSLRS